MKSKKGIFIFIFSIILIVLFVFFFVRKSVFRAYYIQSEMKEIYGIDIKDVSYEKVNGGKLDSDLKSSYKFDSDEKYYYFTATSAYDIRIKGVVDRQNTLLCTNYGMYQYREELAQEVYDKASQVLSDDEFAVFTKYEYEYLVPYADSYEEYKLNIENDYRFTTYLLISDFVQDEEIESIIDSIYEDNYPIKIKIFKEEEQYLAPFVNLKIGSYEKDEKTIREQLGIYVWESVVLESSSSKNTEIDFDIQK